MESQSTVTPQAQKARSYASMYGSRILYSAEGASPDIAQKITMSKPVIQHAVSLCSSLLHDHPVDQAKHEKVRISLRDIQRFVLENFDKKNQSDKMISDSLEKLIEALA